MQKQGTVLARLVDAATRLTNVTTTPRLDAEILLAFALQKNRVWLRAWPDAVLDSGSMRIFDAYVARRLNGEPIAYITGTREFWSLDLAVTPDTLIPRPETELLVEQVIHLAKFFVRPRIVDAGTGSGAIAIALALELRDALIVASDRSIHALVVARDNARRHHAPVCFFQGYWLHALASESVDIVVSNPPYIDADDPHLSQGDVRFEPTAALVSARGGLADIETLTHQAFRVLKPGGYLLVEHGWRQGAPVRELFNAAGFRDITLLRDYADNERVTVGQK